MEPFVERVRGLLLSSFEGSHAELETARPTGKVGGFLIWDGFEGLEPIDRQNRVWGVLREHLDREHQLRITAILTITPAEWEVLHPPEFRDRIKARTAPS